MLRAGADFALGKGMDYRGFDKYAKKVIPAAGIPQGPSGEERRGQIMGASTSTPNVSTPSGTQGPITTLLVAGLKNLLAAGSLMDKSVQDGNAVNPTKPPFFVTHI